MINSNNEYVIWGKQSGNENEEILYTKATSLHDAKTWLKRLESLYAIQDGRIQILNFKDSIDFTNCITI